MISFIYHRNTLDTSIGDLREYSECVKRAAGELVSVCCHLMFIYKSQCHLWRFYSDKHNNLNPKAAKTTQIIESPKNHNTLRFWPVVVISSCRCCAVSTPPCMGGGGAAAGWWCRVTLTSAAPCATGRAPPTWWPAPTRWGIMSPSSSWPTVSNAGNSNQNMGILRKRSNFVSLISVSL